MIFLFWSGLWTILYNISCHWPSLLWSSYSSLALLPPAAGWPYNCIHIYLTVINNLLLLLVSLHFGRKGDGQPFSCHGGAVFVFIFIFCIPIYIYIIYTQIQTLYYNITSLSSSSSSLRLTKRPLSPLELINFYSKINWILEGAVAALKVRHCCF